MAVGDSVPSVLLDDIDRFTDAVFEDVEEYAANSNPLSLVLGRPISTFLLGEVVPMPRLPLLVSVAPIVPLLTKCSGVAVKLPRNDA